MIQTRVMGAGHAIKLDNEWKIARRRVSGENRLEILGPDATDTQRLKEMGLFTEVVSFKTRYFIPLNDQTNDLINCVLKDQVVQNLENKQEQQHYRPRL